MLKGQNANNDLSLFRLVPLVIFDLQVEFFIDHVTISHLINKVQLMDFLSMPFRPRRKEGRVGYFVTLKLGQK